MTIDYDEQHQQALEETGYWGRKGAGSIVFALSTGRILLPLRSEFVLEPNTWGTWGGAIDPTEDAAEAALRELEEEAGFDRMLARDVLTSYLFISPNGQFAYQNFIVVVQDEFEPTLNWESQDAVWHQPKNLPANLHPGLRSLMQSDLAYSQLKQLAEDSRKLQQPTQADRKSPRDMLAEIIEEIQREETTPATTRHQRNMQL